ncbi:hypothetical protein FY133_18335 [Agrobacterium tumefaciens]|nr:hypothetical protein [Agrobacterium tumefaciens]UXT67599.1 hypothetical protein FY133_18335 [Agrobacterium tumefaciens]
MSGRVHGMLRLVPRRVAEKAGRDDVRRDVLAAIASRLDVLGSALKPPCQTWRKSIVHDELSRAVDPHRQLAIEAPSALALRSMFSQILQFV